MELVGISQIIEMVRINQILDRKEKLKDKLVRYLIGLVVINLILNVIAGISKILHGIGRNLLDDIIWDMLASRSIPSGIYVFQGLPHGADKCT